MTSPAQRHMMRVSAAMTAQREAAPLRHATVYEQMLVKLAADQRTLKAIYSKELKAAKKRELLPFWLPWVNGVLEQGKGAQDDILMTVMLWRLDTGDIAGALEIARYALKYGLTMPGKHRRTPPYMFTEEVALAAMRAHAAGESVDTLTLESEPLVKLLEENAYRELIWRQRVNEAARAVMLACAAGNDLDVIGANYNTTRLIITPADDSTNRC